MCAPTRFGIYLQIANSVIIAILCPGGLIGKAARDKLEDAGFIPHFLSPAFCLV